LDYFFEFSFQAKTSKPIARDTFLYATATTSSDIWAFLGMFQQIYELYKSYGMKSAKSEEVGIAKLVDDANKFFKNWEPDNCKHDRNDCNANDIRIGKHSLITKFYRLVSFLL
jgi:hypothetical protein